MKFRFKSDKGLTCQVYCLFRKRTKAIAKHSQHPGRGDEVEVHEIRKEIQKLRALIKLIRGRLTERNYRRESCSLRSAAHGLSPLRDADVSLKSLQQFRLRQHGKVLRSVCDKVKKFLLNRREEAYTDEPKQRKKVYAGMVTAGHLSRDWRLGKIKRSDVIDGIGVSYKRGKNAYHTAVRLRSKENLHEWRKRVKCLRHQLCLIEKFLPRKVLKLPGELKKLSDYLGDDHDLAILQEVAATEALPLMEFKTFSAALALERYHLQQSAFLLGKKLYASNPGGFIRTIQQEWK